MAVTVGLRQRSVNVLTAERDGAAMLDDGTVLARATSLGRVTYSQDEDFLVVAHEHVASGRDFAGVVYAHQLRISIGEAVRDLELIAKVLDPDDMRNRVEYLPCY